MSTKITSIRSKNRLFSKVNNTYHKLSKPQLKFIQKVSFGILKSSTLMLTDIVRSFKSDSSLKQAMKSPDNMLNGQAWQKPLLEGHYEASSPFSNDEIIAIDHTDISKPYAEKMENMSRVRDASSKKKDICNGYKLLAVTRNSMEGRTPQLVNMQILETDKEKGIKETDASIQILQTIDTKLGNKGVRVLDRGFDAQVYFDYFEDAHISFVIRGKENRLAEVIRDNRIIKPPRHIKDIAKQTPCKIVIERWIKNKDEGKRLAQLHLGAVELFATGPQMRLTAVFIKDNHKSEPMILLTNQAINIDDPEEIIKVYEQYRKRWECEEMIRYIKQEYSLEGIRYQKLQNLNSIIAIMVFVDSFLSRDIGCLPKLEVMKQKLMSAAQALGDDPVFNLYRLKHGFQSIFEGVGLEIKQQFLKPEFTMPSFNF